MTTLAFAGSGRITVVHGLAAQHLGLTVTRVASRLPAHAAERARQLGARACGYHDLPGGADAVLVATPPARHATDALAALHAGAAALVEKPLCATLAEADELVAASEATGLALGYAENLAYAPVVRAATALAHTIGPLRHIEARSLQSRPDWGDFTTPDWGGGVLFDLGVHPLAVAMLMAAPARVVEVTASLEAGPDLQVDDLAELRLRFDTGARAHVEASWRDEQALWDLQAASDDAVVRAELLPEISLEHNGEPRAIPASPGPAPELPQLEQFGYTGQLRAFVAAARQGRQPAIGARFGRDVLEVVCAAYASAGQGSVPIALPFAGSRRATPHQLWRG